MSKKILAGVAFLALATSGSAFLAYTAKTKSLEMMTKFHSNIKTAIAKDFSQVATVQDSIESGWMKSSGKLLIKSDAVSTVFNYTIDHGPKAWLSGKPEIVFDLSIPELAKVSDIGQKPFITGNVFADGDQVSAKMTSTKLVVKDKADVQIAAMEATIVHSPKKLDVSFRLPEIAIAHNGSQMGAVKGIAFSMNAGKENENQDYTSQILSFDIAEASASQGMFGFKNFSVKSNAQAKDKKFEVAQSISAGQVVAMGETISQPELAYSFKGFDFDTLVKISKVKAETSDSVEAKRKMIPLLFDLLKKGGEISLDKLNAKWRDGSVSLSIKSKISSGTTPPSISANSSISIHGSATGVAAQMAMRSSPIPGLLMQSGNGASVNLDVSAKGGTLNGRALTADEILIFMVPFIQLDKEFGFSALAPAAPAPAIAQ